MARKNSRSAAGSGTLRQRPDGLWEARFTYVDELGVKRRKSIYAPTQKECRKKLTAATKAVDEGRYKPPQRMTVGEWLDEWVNTYCVGLKPRTISLYKETIKARIKPYIGGIDLQQLTNLNVQRFCNSLSTREKPLSPKTIKNVHGILHKALEQAVVNQIIQFNPSDRIRLPKVRKPELRPLMDDDVSKFIHAIKGDTYETIFLLGLFSGMRQSELLGLQWDDVDFDSEVITVHRQLQRAYSTGGKYIFLDSTKNGKARTVVITPTVVKILKQHQRRQTEWQLAAGELWNNDHNLVFTDELGHHLKHNTVRNHFKAAVSGIGLEKTRFHDLRHSYAINALQNGDSPKEVQNQLGHYSSAFTMDVYVEVSETMRQESRKRMESYIKQVSDL